MVGDSIDDMIAGKEAGAATVLVANEENEWLIEKKREGRDDGLVDLAVRRLDEMIEIFEKGFVGRVGPTKKEEAAAA